MHRLYMQVKAHLSYHLCALTCLSLSFIDMRIDHIRVSRHIYVFSRSIHVHIQCMHFSKPSSLIRTTGFGMCLPTYHLTTHTCIRTSTHSHQHRAYWMIMMYKLLKRMYINEHTFHSYFKMQGHPIIF